MMPAPAIPTLAWFVARTKPNREDHAERTLALRHLRVFLPRIVETGLAAGPIRSPQPAPLFPGYLFVWMNLPLDFQRVIWAPGVRELLCLGGGPVPVDEQVIEQLRLRCDARGVVHVTPAPWLPGDRVEIAAGPFAGLLATVETVLPRRQRIKLLIDFLARQTCVDLPLTAVKGRRGPLLDLPATRTAPAVPGPLAGFPYAGAADNAARVAPALEAV
jgi:transcriptional antiterminator RfaH